MTLKIHFNPTHTHHNELFLQSGIKLHKIKNNSLKTLKISLTNLKPKNMKKNLKDLVKPLEFEGSEIIPIKYILESGVHFISFWDNNMTFLSGDNGIGANFTGNFGKCKDLVCFELYWDYKIQFYRLYSGKKVLVSINQKKVYELLIKLGFMELSDFNI